MAHKSSVMAAFQEGETRFLFARYRSGEPGLYELVNGTAVQVRAFAKTELFCPIPDCPSPEINTVNRKKHRQHFRHKTISKAHAPESLFHVEGKAQIAKWVRANYPDAEVVEERPSSRRRERIADVMVTLADGRRIAIEIQYASLRPDDWQRRHDSYVAQGIRDVWLFGHQGSQLKAVANADQVRLNPTHEAVAATGVPILWFNPEKLLVAHVTNDTDPRAPVRQIAASEGVGDLTVENINKFSLSFEQGLSHERLAALVEGTAQFEVWLLAEQIARAERIRLEEIKAEAKRAADEADRVQFAEARRLEQIQAAERYAAEAPARAKQAEMMRLKQAKRADNAERRDRLATAWPATPEGIATLALFGGQVPAFLSSSTYIVDFDIPSIVWRSHLYLTMIEPLETGGILRHLHLGPAMIARFNLDISPIEAERLAIVWCELLKTAGVLSPGTSQWDAQYDVDKYRKADGRPQPDKPMPTLERAPDDGLVKPRPGLPTFVGMFGPDVPEPRSVRGTNTWRAPVLRDPAPRPAPPEPKAAKCRTCGGPIDPLLVPVLEYHTMCDPEFTGQRRL